MTVSMQHDPMLIDDAELRSFVEDSFANHFGKKRRVRELYRRPHDYQSSFALELLDATFDDGSEIQMLLKNLGPNGMLEKARKVRPEKHYDASHELAIYRDVLAHTSLDTAICYGTDQRHGRTWLLLERVHGEELYQIGDVETWCEAAKWLARMHQRLAPAALNVAPSSLVRYDEEYWNCCINRALAYLDGKRNAGDLDIAPGLLQFLARQSRNAAELARGNSLIHGEFYASNIIVQRLDNRLRICPIDWETAGVGCGAFDLAALLSGNWSDEQKRDLATTYFCELNRTFEKRQFERLMGLVCACRLLLAMKWIGWFGDSQPPVEHRFDWLQEAIQTANELDSIKESVEA